jgi:hypothetical protein
MLEPERGKVFDPCCGSGGMFVQSDVFTKHSGRLSFYGQESKDFTYRGGFETRPYGPYEKRREEFEGPTTSTCSFWLHRMLGSAP